SWRQQKINQNIEKEKEKEKKKIVEEEKIVKQGWEQLEEKQKKKEEKKEQKRKEKEIRKKEREERNKRRQLKGEDAEDESSSSSDIESSSSSDHSKSEDEKEEQEKLKLIQEEEKRKKEEEKRLEEIQQKEEMRAKIIERLTIPIKPKEPPFSRMIIDQKRTTLEKHYRKDLTVTTKLKQTVRTEEFEQSKSFIMEQFQQIDTQSPGLVRKQIIEQGAPQTLDVVEKKLRIQQTKDEYDGEQEADDLIGALKAYQPPKQQAPAASKQEQLNKLLAKSQGLLQGQGDTPDNSKSPKPDNSRSPRPDNSKSPRPDQSRSPKPDNSKSPRPDNSKSPRPDNSKSPRPDQSKSPGLIRAQGQQSQKEKQSGSFIGDLQMLKLLEDQPQSPSISSRRSEKDKLSQTQIEQNKNLSSIKKPFSYNILDNVNYSLKTNQKQISMEAFKAGKLSMHNQAIKKIKRSQSAQKQTIDKTQLFKTQTTLGLFSASRTPSFSKIPVTAYTQQLVSPFDVRGIINRKVTPLMIKSGQLDLVSLDEIDEQEKFLDETTRYDIFGRKHEPLSEQERQLRETERLTKREQRDIEKSIKVAEQEKQKKQKQIQEAKRKGIFIQETEEEEKEQETEKVDQEEEKEKLALEKEKIRKEKSREKKEKKRLKALSQQNMRFLISDYLFDLKNTQSSYIEQHDQDVTQSIKSASISVTNQSTASSVQSPRIPPIKRIEDIIQIEPDLQQVEWEIPRLGHLIFFTLDKVQVQCKITTATEFHSVPIAQNAAYLSQFIIDPLEPQLNFEENSDVNNRFKVEIPSKLLRLIIEFIENYQLAIKSSNGKTQESSDKDQTINKEQDEDGKDWGDNSNIL
ncbi:MAG: hypothetical protein EZS28_035277, partial [Streblomastix strix]